METEAETGAVQLRARNAQVARSHQSQAGEGLSLGTPRRSQPCQQLHFRLPGSRLSVVLYRASPRKLRCTCIYFFSRWRFSGVSLQR